MSLRSPFSLINPYASPWELSSTASGIPPRLQAHSAAVQLGGKEVCGKGMPEALGGVADHGLAQALL